ncbi:hypothetical protein GCM10025857_28220 [Alicyclobacillus contaminans]|uniref:hypothetical protein n=1 Tax=Alicyclobacillus contaminans TaxID=392016 RepID=UPI00041796F0|nr:hypothetical protein [Alicyclobacillus contaminans]GMA51465.1 hypothetical protein GCM10025857_28220 [Alicyclobacillus contaminans]
MVRRMTQPALAHSMAWKKVGQLAAAPGTLQPADDGAADGGRCALKAKNQGLPKVYWITIITILVLVILGAVLWWYDVYTLHS